MWHAGSVTRPQTRTPRRAPTRAMTPLARTRRARRIAAGLADEFPDARCELDFCNPLELAVATILSAQCTDVRVNQVTPSVFARYRSAADYAQANPEELAALIRPTGFYRNKTASIIGLGQALVQRFDGQLPATVPELVTLPGFGRKTANVLMGTAFGGDGITVDTHVGRLARRWSLTENTDPVKVEADLAAQLPQTEWTMFSHRAIYHGRRVCHARMAACGVCYLARQCPSYGQCGPVESSAAAALVAGPEREHLLALVGMDGVKTPQ